MTAPGERLKVMLLFGGRSAEHDISRATAVAVAKALDPARYEVFPVAITTDGAWLLAGEAKALLEGSRNAMPGAFAVEGVQLDELGALVASPGSGGLGIDVVFPLLHGPYGEDGTVQGLLELADLPYVGSGVLGSAVGMDKVMMKRAFYACGIPQARYLFTRDGMDREWFCDTAEESIGFPCFVKPANMGSSIGISKADDRASLENAVEVAIGFDEWVLVEEAIVGREIEVAVLGDAPAQTSLPGEIAPGSGFLNYEAKYEDDALQLIAPASLSDEAADTVRALAIEAFEACRCEAMARVDFFYEEGGRGFLVNELNTIPGFTSRSMYPRLWEVSGLSYPALLDKLFELAIERHGRRAKRAGRQRSN
ncbi:MAG: D-alanine--D-alanine ligase [Acidimicrobiia bacterium]|nr:D-alanine--D-alanine ligase [Acidimicrobiia bacterium]